MINIKFNSNNKKIIGKKDNTTIQLNVIDNPQYIPISLVQQTRYDKILNVITPELYKTNSIVQISNVPLNAEIKTRSSNDNIATIDNNLNVTWISDGDVEIYVGSEGYGEKRSRIKMESDKVEKITDVIGFTVGSLALNISNEINNLISGLLPNNTSQVFWSSINTTTPSAVMNQNLFALSYDFTGIAILRNQNAIDDRHSPVLVSNRHALCAKHVSVQVGDISTWKKQDGTYISATCIDKTDVTYLNTNNDTSVVYYDKDITGVKIYKTMPKNFIDTYCKGLSDNTILTDNIISFSSIPFFRKAMHNINGNLVSSLQINNLTHKQSTILFNASNINNQTVTNNSNSWGIQAIGGDSGGQSFIPLNGELILIGNQYTTIYTHDISDFTTEINSLMNVQAGVVQGTYALTHPNLTAFTAF